ncbi:hypothetical protein [Gottfriedia acidiceleris]|uniref:hypothetical protein n=1 Tax=Gottfriedia acidiceleris TaxID=371036 RepID=UPI000B4510DA|nr:hypothetical protein [Gottfriedia acidiceleris]
MKEGKIIILWSCLILTLGYQISKSRDLQAMQNKNTKPKINIHLVKKTHDNHNIIYTFKMQNDSNNVIKQNNVYMHFNIKTLNGYKMNPFKIEAKGNKLNIRPHEKLILTFKIPIETGLKANLLNMDHPEIEIKGYTEKISNSHLFHLKIQV